MLSVQRAHTLTLINNALGTVFVILLNDEYNIMIITFQGRFLFSGAGVSEREREMAHTQPNRNHIVHMHTLYSTLFNVQSSGNGNIHQTDVSKFLPWHCIYTRFATIFSVLCCALLYADAGSSIIWSFLFFTSVNLLCHAPCTH